MFYPLVRYHQKVCENAVSAFQKQQRASTTTCPFQNMKHSLVARVRVTPLCGRGWKSPRRWALSAQRAHEAKMPPGAEPQAPDLRDQTLHFNKIPRRFGCTRKLEYRCPRSCLQTLTFVSDFFFSPIKKKPRLDSARPVTCSFFEEPQDVIISQENVTTLRNTMFRFVPYF